MSNKVEATFHGMTEDEFERLTGYNVQDCKDHQEFRSYLNSKRDMDDEL